MQRTVELSKEELAALDGLIEKAKAEPLVIPAVVAAATAVVGAAAGVVAAVTAVVQAVQGGGKAAGDRDPLETVAANMLQGKMSADDLIALRQAAVQKKK
jgi:hypothetical protein